MKKIWPYFLLTLANLIYGINYSVAKEVMPDYIKPLGFVLLRCIAACIFFWIIALFISSKNQNKFSSQDWLRIAACAFFGVALNQLCFFSGLDLTAPISSSVIMTTVPIIVLILSYFFLKNPITPVKAIGVFVGLLGALIIIFSENKGTLSASNPILGNTLILINATSYSFYLILAKPLLAKYNSLRILRWMFSFGFLMVLPFGFSELQIIDWQSFTPRIWADVFFVLVFVSCLTYLFNLSALSKVNPSTVSIFIYSQPVFAILYSLWQGNDSFNLMKILGTLFIFVGVYFVISSNFKNKLA